MVYQALLDASQTSNVLRRNARSANEKPTSAAYRVLVGITYRIFLKTNTNVIHQAERTDVQ
jgi:hypothetical protein